MTRFRIELSLFLGSVLEWTSLLTHLKPCFKRNVKNKISLHPNYAIFTAFTWAQSGWAECILYFTLEPYFLSEDSKSTLIIENANTVAYLDNFIQHYSINKHANIKLDNILLNSQGHLYFQCIACFSVRHPKFKKTCFKFSFKVLYFIRNAPTELYLAQSP